MLQLLNIAREQYGSNLPFVLFSKQGEDRVTGIFQEDAMVHPIGDYTKTGFVFAPFDHRRPGFLIFADRTLSVDLETPLVSDITMGNTVLPGGDQTARTFHLELVRKGIAAIKKGILEKVVLSRCFEIVSNASPFDLFSNLPAAYPHAFTYLWYHPGSGMWMGATPELLLHSDRLNLSSMSLAGTVKCEEGRLPDWGPKERQEQKMVTDYIARSLLPYLDDIQVSTPESTAAGSMWHLRTAIRGVMKGHGLQEVINALHPTPAVCGLPADKAKAFILDSEQYNREFYTGFLGEVIGGGRQQTDLYVNLRCMKLEEGRATIYVGGGITADSEPEKEWEETVAKSETMLKVLGYSAV